MFSTCVAQVFTNDMQASLLTQFVFLTLYMFLVFVVANRDFCANVLETQVGKQQASSQLHYVFHSFCFCINSSPVNVS